MKHSIAHRACLVVQQLSKGFSPMPQYPREDASLLMQLSTAKTVEKIHVLHGIADAMNNAKLIQTIDRRRRLL
jgi:hypothetical protein